MFKNIKNSLCVILVLCVLLMSVMTGCSAGNANTSSDPFDVSSDATNDVSNDATDNNPNSTTDNNPNSTTGNNPSSTTVNNSNSTNSNNSGSTNGNNVNTTTTSKKTNSTTKKANTTSRNSTAEPLDASKLIATTTGDLKGRPGFETEEKAIRGLYDAGFRYIDFSMYSNLSQYSVFMSDNWREEVLKLKAVADELGMKFVQAHSPGGNLLSPDQREANALIEATIRSIEICEVLGIKNTVVHPGFGYGWSKEEWFAKNKEMYEKLLPTAKRCGVNVLCENSTKKNFGAGYYYINTGYDMREFIEYVNHPNFHGCWDTGHANCEGSSQYSDILMLGDELYAIHYADNMGDSDSHLIPFFGTLNHNNVMRALKKIDYKGYFTLEAENTKGTYKGPEFSWMKEAFPNTALDKIPQMLSHAQREKLLFDIANYIINTYPN